MLKVRELVAKLDSAGWVLELSQSGKQISKRAQCEKHVTL